MSNLNGDHAVLLRINLSDDLFGTPEEQNRMFDLEERLTEAVEEAGAGTCDGNEFGEGTCTLYFYGSDADQLADTVLAELRKEKLPHGGELLKRYGLPGDADAQEARVPL